MNVATMPEPIRRQVGDKKCAMCGVYRHAYEITTFVSGSKPAVVSVCPACDRAGGSR